MPKKSQSKKPSKKESAIHKITKNDVIEVLKNIFDPELPVNIYDLGLIYNIKVDPKNNISILMTLTTPACPMSSYIVQEVQETLEQMKGAEKVSIDITFDPPWDVDRMSNQAKLDLGLK